MVNYNNRLIKLDFLGGIAIILVLMLHQYLSHYMDYINRRGSDMFSGMDKNECKKLIINSPEIAQMLCGTQKSANEEQVTFHFAFSTACSISNIKKGETFTKENIWVKRSGTGKILAEHFKDILGKTATRDIQNDEQLTLQDII
ncbi:SAF domain-containing protein [Flavobacterium sp.]|uniref:SAF domain-containing protein n=1 Tax=Flavobacterium sp. TaxID=239 RepID=UPI00286AB464|nr:SAF domain-containing protein [Flavobacterium sp.]